MSERDSKHKLAAIFYADVAGYSRLTGEDEIGTHNRVMDVLDFASETIKSDGGVVLRYAGDAILAEFSSVVAAVKSAAFISYHYEQDVAIVSEFVGDVFEIHTETSLVVQTVKTRSPRRTR